MPFKKASRSTAAILVMLMFALCLGATAAGTIQPPNQQPKDGIPAAESQNSDSDQTITTVPVDIETVKDGTFVRLGAFSLSYGDEIRYDVSAEKGNGLKTGFAAPEEDPLNRTYFSISNKREDGTLEAKGSFTFEAPVAPGPYNLFLLATDGDLTNVSGSITIEANQSLTPYCDQRTA